MYWNPMVLTITESIGQDSKYNKTVVQIDKPPKIVKLKASILK